MADPFTILAIGSAVLGAVGSVMAGKAAASAAAERQAVAELNAERSEENAERTQQVAQIQAQDQDFLTLAILGTQESRQTGSGLVGRSQLLARKTARELGRRDALNVVQAGKVRAFNFKVEAENQRSAARVEEISGKNSLLQGFIGAGQSLIGGARTAKFGPTPRFDPLRTR